MFKKPITNILVKPSGPDCNMDCSYCFYSKKVELFSEVNLHRMSDELLQRMIMQLMDQNVQEVSISWQGGEPTLMGLSFFKKAVDLQQHFGQGKIVGNGLQTNGTLIDQEWADFFKQYNFLIGLSIDGLEHIHDHYRHLISGKGSWGKVSATAKLLLENDVAVNALSVVNDYSAQFPEEIYNYLKEEGLTYMQFIPCVEMDPKNPDEIAQFSVNPEQFGKFLVKLFDLWINDFQGDIPTTSIRFFESLLFKYAGVHGAECTLHSECGSYVVVEHNGDVYSCDFFVLPEWKLGNIADSNIVDMLNSEKQREFGSLKAVLPDECNRCEWLNICRGGCTKDRINNPDNQKLNYLCPGYKYFFERTDKGFKKLVANWEKKNNEQRNTESYEGVHRNDPCPCGSGLKYKKCCGK